MGFFDDVKEFDGAAGAAVTPLTTGTYKAVITDVQLDVSVEPMKGHAVLKLIEHEGDRRVVFKNWKLEGKQKWYFQQDLIKLGVDTTDVADVNGLMNKVMTMLDMKVEVYIKVTPKEDGNGVWENVYFNKNLNNANVKGHPTAVVAQPPVTSMASEELPF